ncbi:retrovirus-related pol polyprotein from transposon TNT 1-94 [Tanacetum coccineum]
MLLMALPNEHLMTFNQYKDAKTLFAAIQTRFGGNEATKKTQKTLLKKMYKSFLDSIFNRLQKIWDTHVIVWRNKPDLDTMSFNDLYNNFKIVEQEIKGTASSSSSSSYQNMTFVSSPSSTNEVNTAYGVSTANTQVSSASTASTQVSTANLSDDTIYTFLASQPNGSQLVYKDLEQIHEDDIEEMDLKWQLALLSMRTRSTRWDTLQGNVEDLGTNIAGTGIKTTLEGLYMADDEVSTNMALMAFSDSEDSSKKIRSRLFDIRDAQGTYMGKCPYLSQTSGNLMERIFTLWGEPKAEAVNIACYVQNKVLLVKPYNKTLYELFRGRTPALIFMRPFGCHVTILNTLEYYASLMEVRWKRILFDTIEKVRLLKCTEESIGAGHSSKETRSSQDYILMPLGKDGLLFDSSLKNASNNEPQPSSDAGKKDDEGEIMLYTEATHDNFFGDETEVDMSNITTTYPVPSTPNIRIHKDHSLDHVIGDIQRAQKVIQALKDPTGNLKKSPLNAINASAVQVTIGLDLVDLPLGKRAISTKWVYRNKKDERVSRIEVIRLFLAYASFKDFVVYEMDVKSAFLYGKIEEEVYVCQPLGFEDPEFPDRVYKVEKALYGLHQAPRAWYETLSTYLLDNGFQRGQIDKTLFIKRVKSDILLAQMSSMGELTFFLGLQVTQKDDGIFISQDKSMDEILKKFSFSTMKTASTPMETSKPLLKDA